MGVKTYRLVGFMATWEVCAKEKRNYSCPPAGCRTQAVLHPRLRCHQRRRHLRLRGRQQGRLLPSLREQARALPLSPELMARGDPEKPGRAAETDGSRDH